MKKFIAIIFTLGFVISNAYAQQEKGVDKQNERIRDAGNSRAPATNGRKQDVGIGPGINFGRGKTPDVVQIPNPYRFTMRRDELVQNIEELMRERKLVLDAAASKASEGLLVSQPYTFIKGAVASQSELSQYAEVPEDSARAWTRGRYTISVEVMPVDALNTNVSVNAKVEGRTDGIAGGEWTTLRSTGAAEQEFLAALIERVTGQSPPGRVQ